jgi:hypothetical protein
MKAPAKPTSEATATQFDYVRLATEATAQITAAMVQVTQEKNPAKIGEAFKAIYKGIHEVIAKSG